MKRDAQSIRISNSLPQSPAATAPSSEGAKGLGCACGQARQREPRGGRRSLVPSSPVLRPKRRGFTGGTWFRPSDRARPALRCRPAFPQKRPRSRGGSGGHFAFGKKAPRRPFCPLSAGGKWTPFSAPAGAELFSVGHKKGPFGPLFYLAESVGFEPTVLAHAGLVPHKSCAFAGAPLDQTASVAAHSGSLRHDGGTGRRFLKTGAKKGPCGPLFLSGGECGIRTHGACARRFSRPVPSTARPTLRMTPGKGRGELLCVYLQFSGVSSSTPPR